MRSESRPRLTDRQADVLNAIREVLERDGRPPTIRELGERLGIRATNGVNDHLKALERKGYVVREPRMSRTLRVIEQTDGAAVLEQLARDWPLGGRDGAGDGDGVLRFELPRGRFTPSELAAILARSHREIVYADGVVTIGDAR